MAKALVMLIAVAATAGAAYAYRADIPPLADRVLPAQAAAVIKRALPIEHTDQGARPTTTGSGAHAAESSPASARRGKGGPAPVTAGIAVLADMPVILNAPGTVEAMATVGIKARVDGQITEVLFKEGDLVTAGSVLFRLDPRLVKAQIRQAEATITRDRASLKDAISNQDRKETLLRKKYASEAITDTARQQVEVLKASIAAGEAALDMQRTQLDYLTIRAPITGRTGSMTAKLGAFVRSADPGFIVTINQTKPIAVAFALPQANLLALKDALNRGAKAVIKVPGSKPVAIEGRLWFVDNQVDKTTGTLTAKVQVDNPDETLWPGQAVNVALTVAVRKNMIAVPASAVLPAQQGMIAWVIGDGDRVTYRVVEQDRVLDQTAYLTSGLKPGERVVTDGQLRLAKGAKIVIRDLNKPAGAKSGKRSAKRSGTGPEAKSGGAPDAARNGAPGNRRPPRNEAASEPPLSVPTNANGPRSNNRS